MGATAKARRLDRLEWAAALGAAVLSLALMFWVGRSMWFRLDVWDFLVGRPAGSLESWIRPHAGHLQWVTVGLHRFLYGTVGIDFWPWYYLPHLLGHAGLSLLLWRVVLRRGAGRGVAFAAYLVTLVLGVSAFLSSIVIGGLLVLTLLLLVAERLDSDAAPAPITRVLVMLALLVMATSSSLGVAAVACCFLALALTRGLRAWWWCFLPAAAAYGAWYALRGAEAPQGAIGWSHLGRAPGDALRLLGNATGRLFGWTGGGVALGAVVAVLLAAGVGWLAWKRRLRCWDLVFAGSLAAYLLMLAMVRGAAGKPLELARYAYPLVLLVLPLVVPRLRLPGRLPRAVQLAVLLVVGAGLVGVNAWERVAQTNAIELEAAAGRVAIEGVGQVLAAGEPGIEALRLKNDLGIGTAGVLTVADVRSLLASGWEPAPTEDWGESERVRGLLRVSPSTESRADGAPPLRLGRDAPEGCVEVRPGGSRRFVVAAAGVFSLERASRFWESAVELTWRDRFGEFSQQYTVGRRSVLAVAAPPEGGAALRISNFGERYLRVCGVAAAG